MKIQIAIVALLIGVLIIGIKYADIKPIESRQTIAPKPVSTTVTPQPVPELPPLSYHCDPYDVSYLGDRTIKAQLKAPSTAEFASFGDTKIFQRQDTITYISYVDAQNGFGAMIRSKFAVVMICHDGKLAVIDSALE